MVSRLIYWKNFRRVTVFKPFVFVFWPLASSGDDAALFVSLQDLQEQIIFLMYFLQDFPKQQYITPQLEFMTNLYPILILQNDFNVLFKSMIFLESLFFSKKKCRVLGPNLWLRLVHPTCGPTQPGDIDGLVRIQTYEALKDETKQEFPMFRWAYLSGGPKKDWLWLGRRSGWACSAGSKQLFDG